MKHNIDTIKRSFKVSPDFALAEVEAFEKELRERGLEIDIPSNNYVWKNDFYEKNLYT